MNSFNGKLRQWRGLLSLFLFSCTWVRSNNSGRYLRSRVPSFCRGFTIWIIAITRENRVYIIRIKYVKRMIRRWSCLNEVNEALRLFTKFKKSFRFITFRTSVSFKRYTRKTTKLKRKSLIRVKHATNWIPYSNVVALWARDFIFWRHIASFQYFNRLFLKNFYLYNFNLIKTNNSGVANNFNFFFSTISHKAYFYFNPQFNLRFINNARITLGSCNDQPLFDKTAVPVYYNWENQLYLFKTTFINSSHLDDFWGFLHFFYTFQIFEMYKIIALFTFFQLEKFKKVK
jgi:hypothetical protein